MKRGKKKKKTGQMCEKKEKETKYLYGFSAPAVLHKTHMCHCAVLTHIYGF